MSLNDWGVLAYLAMLEVAVLASPNHGAARDRALLEVSGLLFCFFTVVVVLVRGGILTHPWVRPLAFRICHYGGIQATYFIMRGLLPVVNPGSLDLELHQLGMRWFGVEPALALQSWVSPATTEWFAFFYYGYFFVLGLHVIPIIFFGRNSRLLSEFALGLLLVLAVGQSLYLLVPGYGPAKGLPELFSVELPNGVWWHLVKELVASAGAQKDIFPSIHTAAPSFILLFSFHNRAHLPYRYSWPLVAFFVFNIIVATMFLRWHWLVDIVAGLVLALLAFAGSVYGARWEARYRSARGLPLAWPAWPGSG
ncbi:MAG TPA: phosphatase PAP2 family protein [Polyangiaceae bacterium]|nr:phosphatase PAP2 family protein [Polyangiaceae bacterium]